MLSTSHGLAHLILIIGPGDTGHHTLNFTDEEMCPSKVQDCSVTY